MGPPRADQLGVRLAVLADDAADNKIAIVAEAPRGAEDERYPPDQGFSTGTPSGAKCFTLRVTTVRPCR